MPLVFLSASLHADEAGLDRAATQFRDFYLGGGVGLTTRDSSGKPAASDDIAKHVRSLKPDGSWPDVDYASKARSSWPAANHSSRLLAMSTEFARGTADQPGLAAAIHRAFVCWIKKDPQCPNWWYNQIGVPKDLATAGLLLGKELNAAEKTYLLKVVMPRTKIGMTGQNKLWLAGNTFMLGLIGRDEAAIRDATNAIWDEVAIGGGEGVQPDASFHQHGPQQQFGNYGLAFAVELGRWATILGGTPWALPPERVGTYRNYLLDGMNWTCWRGSMDIGSCGRQFSPGSPIRKAAMVSQAMECAASFDGENAAAYRAFVKRNQPDTANDLIGNRLFWRSDYVVQRNAKWSAALKMSSNRTIGSEVVNDENLSGYHLADGMLCLYRTGREYEDIFPLWDWKKLPGTTNSQGTLPSFKTSTVATDFTGGVSDGANGIAVLDYAKDGVTAKKAWFFNGQTVVALGSDIRGPDEEEVMTTLEQNLLQGPLKGSESGRIGPVTPGTTENLQWVEHAGFRYTLLEKSLLTVAAGPVTGNWNRIFRSPATPKSDVTQPVFLLSINHGRKSSSGSYAYAISTADEKPLALMLRNNSGLQAVKLGPTLTGVVFWKAGEFRPASGETLQADQPCVVLYDSATQQAHLADPTQKLSSLRLSLGARTFEAELPTGGLAGRSVKVSLVR